MEQQAVAVGLAEPGECAAAAARLTAPPSNRFSYLACMSCIVGHPCMLRLSMRGCWCAACLLSVWCSEVQSHWCAAPKPLRCMCAWRCCSCRLRPGQLPQPRHPAVLPRGAGAVPGGGARAAGQPRQTGAPGGGGPAAAARRRLLPALQGGQGQGGRHTCLPAAAAGLETSLGCTCALASFSGTAHNQLVTCPGQDAVL